MKYDEELNGNFIGGKFIKNRSPENDIEGFSIDNFQFKIESIDEIVRNNLESNLPIMPNFLDLKENHDENLFSIYKQAYICVACGQYDAGIILLGQLMEMTLRQIIFIKKNELKDDKSFGAILKYAWYNDILEYEDYAILDKFNRKVRNPYTHRKFKEIIGFRLVPVWKFPTQVPGTPFDVKEFPKIIEKVMDGVKKGKYRPQMIDPTKDPTFACQAKESLDPITAIVNIWIISMKFEELMNIYLNPKAYEEYRLKYGSPFDKIALIHIFEDEDDSI